jgi:hypothetical protein
MAVRAIQAFITVTTRSARPRSTGIEQLRHALNNLFERIGLRAKTQFRARCFDRPFRAFDGDLGDFLRLEDALEELATIGILGL